MKVIFLDFDGVICTGRQAIASGERGVISGLDPVAMGFLNRICRDNDLKVVISSSWRSGKARDDFKNIFACGGYYHLAKALHSFWSTATLNDKDSTRGHEIQLWLDMHDCDGYCIIDDDDRMLPDQLQFFVHTDSIDGMLYDHYQKVLKVLGIPD